jgi:TetR/AcrR family hemagglutinin/protease transcriptional regulator
MEPTVVPVRKRAAQLSPEERRDQLLQHAIAVFAKHGLGSAGHSQIARAAGVSVPTVFSYFPTKMALVEAVVGAVETYIFDLITRQRCDQPNPTTFERLYRVMLAWSVAAETHPDIVKVFLNWSTSFHPDIKPLFDAYFERVVSSLEEIVREGYVNGEFGSDVDTRDAALILQGSGNLIAHLKFSNYDKDKMTKLLVDVVQGAVRLGLSENTNQRD